MNVIFLIARTCLPIYTTPTCVCASKNTLYDNNDQRIAERGSWSNMLVIFLATLTVLSILFSKHDFRKSGSISFNLDFLIFFFTQSLNHFRCSWWKCKGWIWFRVNMFIYMNFQLSLAPLYLWISQTKCIRNPNCYSLFWVEKVDYTKNSMLW